MIAEGSDGGDGRRVTGAQRRRDWTRGGFPRVAVKPPESFLRAGQLAQPLLGGLDPVRVGVVLDYLPVQVDRPRPLVQLAVVQHRGPQPGVAPRPFHPLERPL